MASSWLVTFGCLTLVLTVSLHVLPARTAAVGTDSDVDVKDKVKEHVRQFFVNFRHWLEKQPESHKVNEALLDVITDSVNLSLKIRTLVQKTIQAAIQKIREVHQERADDINNIREQENQTLQRLNQLVEKYKEELAKLAERQQDQKKAQVQKIHEVVEEHIQKAIEAYRKAVDSALSKASEANSDDAAFEVLDEPSLNSSSKENPQTKGVTSSQPELEITCNNDTQNQLDDGGGDGSDGNSSVQSAGIDDVRTDVFLRDLFTLLQDVRVGHINKVIKRQQLIRSTIRTKLAILREALQGIRNVSNDGSDAEENGSSSEVKPENLTFTEIVLKEINKIITSDTDKTLKKKIKNHLKVRQEIQDKIWRTFNSDIDSLQTSWQDFVDAKEDLIEAARSLNRECYDRLTLLQALKSKLQELLLKKKQFVTDKINLRKKIVAFWKLNSADLVLPTSSSSSSTDSSVSKESIDASKESYPDSDEDATGKNPEALVKDIFDKLLEIRLKNVDRIVKTQQFIKAALQIKLDILRELLQNIPTIQDDSYLSDDNVSPDKDASQDVAAEADLKEIFNFFLKQGETKLLKSSVTESSQRSQFRTEIEEKFQTEISNLKSSLQDFVSAKKEVIKASTDLREARSDNSPSTQSLLKTLQSKLKSLLLKKKQFVEQKILLRRQIIDFLKSYNQITHTTLSSSSETQTLPSEISELVKQEVDQTQSKVKKPSAEPSDFEILLSFIKSPDSTTFNIQLAENDKDFNDPSSPDALLADVDTIAASVTGTTTDRTSGDIANTRRNLVNKLIKSLKSEFKKLQNAWEAFVDAKDKMVQAAKKLNEGRARRPFDFQLLATFRSKLSEMLKKKAEYVQEKLALKREIIEFFKSANPELIKSYLSTAASYRQDPNDLKLSARSNNNGQNDDAGQGGDSAVVVGVVLACLAISAIVGVVGLVLWKRNRRQRLYVPIPSSKVGA